MDENPHKATDQSAGHPSRSLPIRAILGNTVCFIGAGGAAYGALAFWVFQALPPNDLISGRLPSLYLLAGGMALLLVGLTIRNLRVR